MPAHSRTLTRLVARRLHFIVEMSVSAALVGTVAIPGATAPTAAASTAVPHTSVSAAWLRADAATRAAVPYAVVAGTAAKIGPLAATQKLRLVLALAPRDTAGEQRLIAETQDPKSPQFEHFLTPAEFAARFAPAATNESAVVDWARSKGLTVTNRYPNRMLVDVEGTVATIQHAFAVHLNAYDVGGQPRFANDAAPQLPAALRSVVQSVQGLDDIQQMQPSSPLALAHPVRSPVFSPGPAARAGASGHGNGNRSLLAEATSASARKLARPRATGGAYDPTDIFSSQAYDYSALYNQGHCCNPTHTANTTPPQTSVAIATVGTQLGTDISGFHDQYPFLAFNFNQEFVDGTPAAGDIEGTMDAEWVTATSNSFGCACDTAHVFLYDGANGLLSTFTDIYNRMLSDGNARVMSTSFGCAEVFCATAATMDSQHAIFDAMTLQGWTLVGISHDHGALADCSHLSVSYPGSDPDLVSSGGTQLELSQGPSFLSESAWEAGSAGCLNNDGGTGGGCSAHFARPGYQSNAACGAFRSVPDIALNADGFAAPQNIVFNGALQHDGGTSIVAPEISGFFAQLNAYRLTLGAGPLGSGVAALYGVGISGAPHVPFYDVLHGCNGIGDITGFCAHAGYDLVTGWGSANMLQLAWAINWRSFGDNGQPTVAFTGPAKTVWHNTPQLVNWTVADTGGLDTPTGVAGFSDAIDRSPGDPVVHATPGAGDPFFDGPQFPNATNGSVTFGGGLQGCHTVFVMAWDNQGLDSSNQAYGPVCVDTVPPTVPTRPTATLASGTKLTAQGVPVAISWSSSDGTSGIASYSVQRKVDSGPFTTVMLPSAASTSIEQPLQPGHSYQYRVTATDNAGNTSATSTGPSFRVSLVQENGGPRYSSGWTRQAVKGASGGDVEFSTAKGKTATLKFTGSQIAWVTTVTANHGVATVTVDGKGKASIDTSRAPVDLAAADANAVPMRPAIIEFARSFNSGTHTILVTNAATKGRPRVDVDAFVILS